MQAKKRKEDDGTNVMTIAHTVVSALTNVSPTTDPAISDVTSPNTANDDVNMGPPVSQHDTPPLNATGAD